MAGMLVVGKLMRAQTGFWGNQDIRDQCMFVSSKWEEGGREEGLVTRADRGQPGHSWSTTIKESLKFDFWVQQLCHEIDKLCVHQVLKSNNLFHLPIF